MPKIVDHEQRRALIARAALRLCAREGLGAVTIGRVAGEAEISKGLVQHYFPTKEALLQSAATTLRLDIQAFVAASVRVGDEPKKLLRQVLLALINLNPDQVLASHAFLAFTAADPHVHRLYREGSAAVTAAITDLIATAGGPEVAADAEARILLGLAGSLADARMLGEIDLRQATAVLDLQLQRIHQS